MYYMWPFHYWHRNHTLTYQGRHRCTQWKTWYQKLWRVLPNHTKSWGEETVPSPRSTRYVTLTSIEEISWWLRHLFCLLHRNATKDGIKKTPPKFAIANGFVIGSFRQEIKFFNKEGQRVTRKVLDDALTDTLKAMVAPLRSYGCVFAYSGGAQKSLRQLSVHWDGSKQSWWGDKSTQLSRHWLVS
jgi:hypothetical protein